MNLDSSQSHNVRGNQLFWNRELAKPIYRDHCASLGLNNCITPVNCEVSPWEEWSPCSEEECGGGISTRHRTVQVSAEYGGKECPDLLDVQGCNTAPCPVDCIVSPWSEWTDCNSQCNGKKHRARQVDTPMEYGGEECPPISESEACNTDCTLPCKMGKWSPWSECTEPCNKGSQTRTREVIQHAYRDTTCSSVLQETQACNDSDCASCDAYKKRFPQDYLAESTRKQCKEGCGWKDGVLVDCKGDNIFKIQNNTCVYSDPVDCEVGGWSTWGLCSASCGPGIKSRTRSPKTRPSGGGKACDKLIQTAPCNNKPCPVDCEVGEWGDWSSCPSGANQTRSRTRSVTRKASGGGKCPPIRETQPCNVCG